MLDELVSVLGQKIVRAAQVIIFFLRSVSYQKIIWFSDQIFGSVNNQKANIKPLERTVVLQLFKCLVTWVVANFNGLCSSIRMISSVTYRFN